MIFSEQHSESSHFQTAFSPSDSITYHLTQLGSYPHSGLWGQEGHLHQIVPPGLHLMGKGLSPKENPEVLPKVGMAQKVKHDGLPVLWVPTSILPLPLFAQKSKFLSLPDKYLSESWANAQGPAVHCSFVCDSETHSVCLTIHRLKTTAQGQR